MTIKILAVQVLAIIGAGAVIAALGLLGVALFFKFLKYMLGDR